MICVILVAGHGTLLENEIKRDTSGLFAHLEGVPKALLPGVGGKKILDFWWEALRTRQLFSEVYMVTNADKFKHFERWATANEFPVKNIVNDGSSTEGTRLGAVADFHLAVRTKAIDDHVLVVAGDMLCGDQNFDIIQVLKFFRLKDGELAIYYEMEESEITSSRGILEVCPMTHRIQRFFEKPKPGVTGSRLASVVFYCFRKTTLATFPEFLSQQPHPSECGFGKYMEWLVNESDIPVYGMKLPGGFHLIGQVGLSDYQKWLSYYSQRHCDVKHRPITCRAYARVGLMGNPSDGFHGKTIAMTIANFWADATITGSKTLVLVPHPLNDPTEFGSLHDLYGISRKEGYLGGLRLLQATCKRFYHYCAEHGIALAKRNFTLKYDTNIPRQVGLAGSSAIVTATVKCLMRFYSLTDDDLPKAARANFILGVEMDELFINAGLQDRVVQVYEGLVYMDFSKELMEEQGFGNYVSMSMACLPKFWLAYLGDPSDSGKIHSDVRQRWLNGDQDVVEAMKKFAELTDQAKMALEASNWTLLAELMNQNFDLRRSLYTDACLGSANLNMVELARQFGAAVKFPGSGGAVVGVSADPPRLAEMKKAFQQRGYVVCDVVPYDPSTKGNTTST